MIIIDRIGSRKGGEWVQTVVGVGGVAILLFFLLFIMITPFVFMGRSKFVPRVA